MRKRLLLMAVVALAALTQCKKPSDVRPGMPGEGNVEVSFEAKNNGGAKSDINDLGITTWNSGDKVYAIFKNTSDGNYYTLGGNLTAKADGKTVNVSGNLTSTSVVFIEPTSGATLEFHFYYIGAGVANAAGTADFAWPGADQTGTSFTMNIHNQQRNASYDAGEYQIAHAKATMTYNGTKWTIDGTVNFTLITATVRLDTGIGGTVTLTTPTGSNGGSNPYNNGSSWGKAESANIFNIVTINTNDPEGFTCSGGDGIMFNGDRDVYVEVLPTGTTDDITVDVLWSADGGTGSFPIKGGIERNHLYCRVIDNWPYQIPLQSNGDWVNFNEPRLGVIDLPIWAKYNIGVDKNNLDHAYDWYGDYYAWGEIAPYYADGHSQESPCTHWRTMTTGAGNTVISNGYAWETYSQGGSSSFAEWTTPPYGSDNILLLTRDAANNANGSLRMPTGDSDGEWQQLASNTYFQWTTNYNGVSGLNGYIVYKVKDAADKGLVANTCSTPSLAGSYSTSDPHIFLPASGSRYDTNLANVGSYGYYRSSSFCSYPLDSAWHMFFNSDYVTRQDSYPRYFGFSVRPVYITGTSVSLGSHPGVNW